MAAPKTLTELATSAGIPEAELKLYDPADFDELLKELGIPVTVKVRLKKQHRDLLSGLTQATAQTKFDAFLSRVGGADALAGLDKVPLASLDDALAFIKGPGAPSPETLRDAATTAYAKADGLLACGPDPHGLSRDEIAAVNIYTQQALYRQLNAAMRTEVRSNVKAYWGYIRLLQHALFKLPKVSGSQAIFRGIKEPDPDIDLAELEAMIASQEHQVWWGFSSTSTNLQAVNAFLGSAKRVIYTIDGGSSARDVKRYSDYVQEDELLMPCGSAFIVNTASSPAPNLLLVSVRQTSDFLIQGVVEEVVPVVEPSAGAGAEPEPEPAPAPAGSPARAAAAPAPALAPYAAAVAAVGASGGAAEAAAAIAQLEKMTLGLDDGRPNAEYMANPAKVALAAEAGGPEAVLGALDCCRESAEVRAGYGGGEGLTGLAGPVGSLVMYATGEGGYAKDGLDGSEHGVFTDALLKVLDQPGLNLVDMCAEVQKEVESVTGGEQKPDFQAGGGMMEIRELSKISLVAKAEAAEAPEPAPASGMAVPAGMEEPELLQRGVQRARQPGGGLASGPRGGARGGAARGRAAARGGDPGRLHDRRDQLGRQSERQPRESRGGPRGVMLRRGVQCGGALCSVFSVSNQSQINPAQQFHQQPLPQPASHEDERTKRPVPRSSSVHEPTPKGGTPRRPRASTARSALSSPRQKEQAKPPSRRGGVVRHKKPAAARARHGQRCRGVGGVGSGVGRVSRH